MEMTPDINWIRLGGVFAFQTLLFQTSFFQDVNIEICDVQLQSFFSFVRQTVTTVHMVDISSDSCGLTLSDMPMCLFFTLVSLGNALFALPACPRLTIFVATIIRHKSTQIAKRVLLTTLTTPVSLSALQSFVNIVSHFAAFMHTLTPLFASRRVMHLTKQSQLRNPSHIDGCHSRPTSKPVSVSFVNQLLTR